MGFLTHGRRRLAAILVAAAFALFGSSDASGSRSSRSPAPGEDGNSNGPVEALPDTSNGRGAWLGIEVIDAVVEDQRGGWPRPAGAMVTGVVPGSPAEAAGLHKGDVIIALDGKEVTSPEGLIRVVNTQSPGSTVQMEWLRGRRGLRAPVRLGGNLLPSSERGAIVRAGIEVRTVRARISPLPGGAARRALLVTALLRATGLGRGGRTTLLPGDLIDEVNRRIVRTPDEMREALERAPAGSPAIVRRIRGDQVDYVAVPTRANEDK